MKILKVIGLIVGVVLVGIAVGWWGTRGTGSGTQRTGEKATTSASAPAREPAPVTAQAPVQPELRVKPKAVSASAPVSEVATNLITDWEDRLDEILSTEGNEADKAKQLAEMFPRLPQEGQVEVAQHLANLTDDKDYANIGNFLTNSAMPEDVLDVLMADLLNRPNSVKLPLLLDVARNENNPKATDAKDLLELFLEENYGHDWAQWQTKLQQWLQENPD